MFFMANESRAEKMVRELKQCGENSGLVIQNGQVTIMGPGSPFTPKPTMYTQADLDEAVRLGLAQESQWEIARTDTGQTWSVKGYFALYDHGIQVA
jgi:hypothetical protein